MRGLTSRLNQRLTVYSKQAFINEIGENDYKYIPLKTVWGEIINWGGSNTIGSGNADKESTSHRIIIRNNALKEITNDMYFVHKGVRHDIENWNPSYKYNDFIEILAKRKEGSKYE